MILQAKMPWRFWHPSAAVCNTLLRLGFLLDPILYLLLLRPDPDSPIPGAGTCQSCCCSPLKYVLFIQLTDLCAPIGFLWQRFLREESCFINGMPNSFLLVESLQAIFGWTIIVLSVSIRWQCWHNPLHLGKDTGFSQTNLSCSFSH